MCCYSMQVDSPPGGEEGLALAGGEAGGENHQVHTAYGHLLLDLGLSHREGLEDPGCVALSLQEQGQGVLYHRVCAKDCYGCRLVVVVALRLAPWVKETSEAVPLDREGVGAVTPRLPLVGECALPPLGYFILK